MRTAKIAISMDKNLLLELDNLVDKKRFESRSQAIQIAVRDKIDKLKKKRLTLECNNLDINSERSLAEESFLQEFEQWPEY